MSFYGNILNRLDKFWRYIKVKTSDGTVTNIAAEENGVITLTSSDGISLSTIDTSININGGNLATSVKINTAAATPGSNFTKQDGDTIQLYNGTTAIGSPITTTYYYPNASIVEDTTDSSDGFKKYKFTYGDNTSYINIPLDLILKEAKLVTRDAQGTNGNFIKLVFHTSEGTGEDIVYINVTDLYKITGGSTDTITITVNNNNNNITAIVNDNSITTNHLADNVLTSDNIKFSQDLITTFDIGNIKTQNGMAIISAKDKNLNEVWESIYMKEINTDL